MPVPVSDTASFTWIELFAGRQDHQRRHDEGRAREDEASFAHPESERSSAGRVGRGVADVEERGRLDGARKRGKEDVEAGDDRRVLREVADRVVRPEAPRAAHRGAVANKPNGEP